MLEVNVGLATNDGGSIDVAEAVEALQAQGFIVTAQRVVHAEHAKGGERTLVARLFDYRIKPHVRLFFVAQALRQDCIAAVQDGFGYLVGPDADKWGSFSAAYFHPFSEAVAA